MKKEIGGVILGQNYEKKKKKSYGLRSERGRKEIRKKRGGGG